MRLKANILAIHTIDMFARKMEFTQEASQTYCQIWWWVIDVLEMFCCQWYHLRSMAQFILKS